MTYPNDRRLVDEDAISIKIFYRDFLKHCEDEESWRKKNCEIYEALFRIEDPSKGIAPGLFESMSSVNDRLRRIEDENKKHRTFAAGVAFAISGVWFFLTDFWAKLISLLHKL